MIQLRTWKVLTCIVDLVILALFVVQIEVVRSKSIIQDEILHYNLKHSSVDIVGLSIVRTLIALIVYIIVKSKALFPEIIIAVLSTGALGAKGYFLYLGYGSKITSSDSAIIMLYSFVVTLASLIGTIIIWHRWREEGGHDGEGAYYYTTGKGKKSMWTTSTSSTTTTTTSTSTKSLVRSNSKGETLPLMRSINDGSGAYAPADNSLHPLPPSEGRYFENLPTTQGIYLYDDKEKQNSVPRIDDDVGGGGGGGGSGGGFKSDANGNKMEGTSNSSKDFNNYNGGGNNSSNNVSSNGNGVANKKGDSDEAPNRPKKMVMPSIPRLIVLMLAPGTGIPVKEVKIKTPNKGEELKRCFSGKVGVDWILSVMPRIKKRDDCLHIAQQLVDKQFILPLKPPKNNKPPAFLDDDSILYYFGSEIENITGSFRADSMFLGPQSSYSSGPMSSSSSDHLTLPPRVERPAFDRPIWASQRPETKEPLNQFLAPPKISTAMKNFLIDMTNPHTGVPVATHNINSVSISNCFSGKEAVDWMIARMGLEGRDQGAKILQSMLTKNILLLVYPSMRRSPTFEDSDTSLYTLCSIGDEQSLQQESQKRAAQLASSPPPPPVLSSTPPPAPTSEFLTQSTPQNTTSHLSVSVQYSPLPPVAPQLPRQQQNVDYLSSSPFQPTSQLQPKHEPPEPQPRADSPPLTQPLLYQEPQLHFQPTLSQSQAQPTQQPVPPPPEPQTQPPQPQPPQLQEQPPPPPPQQKPSELLQSQPLLAQEKAKNNKANDEPTVAEWLQSINLGHLASVFDAEDITFDIIPIMDETDLEALGIHPSDMKVLLKHIKILKAKITKQAEDKLKKNKKK